MYLKYSFDNLLEIILNYKSKRCSQDTRPCCTKVPSYSRVYIYILDNEKRGIG